MAADIVKLPKVLIEVNVMREVSSLDEINERWAVLVDESDFSCLGLNGLVRMKTSDNTYFLRDNIDEIYESIRQARVIQAREIFSEAVKLLNEMSELRKEISSLREEINALK